MAKYKKKPVVIEAKQWFKNGDHPEDNVRLIPNGITGEDSIESEGNIVHYFRHPKIDGMTKCVVCGKIMHLHGWIDTLEAGHRVCPGDWIITGVAGKFYPCKPDIFEKTYEKVEE